ncbi:MAG: thioredoxin-like domain-containing protein [Pseudobdellovibrionaceae bacterium]|jgi:thiol-disulfide isomerase/thioredoxin|nr:thioredoxin-like domain-containing protein [Pseudobdellovibrionaceae bacterium]
MKQAFIFLLAIWGIIGSANASTLTDTLSKGGAGGWLNVERPLTQKDMDGKILLLDFWTYGCVNCMQIVPDLEFLEHKYGDKLLVIGVHSAKYKGEQDNDRILSAAKRFGLNHPIANDYDYAIWKSFGVNAWPTLIVLGANGQEISRYSGEGHRTELDRDIGRHISSATNTSSNEALVLDHRTDTSLSFPARLEIFGNGFVIADAGHNQIVITDNWGKILTRIGNGKKSLKDGSYEIASFNNPRGLKAVGDKIYIADTGNHALRVIDTTKQTVRTLAGNGKRGYNHSIKNDRGTSVSLASPWDIEIMPHSDENKLAIATAGLHQLHVYDIPSGKISVLAGSGYEDIEDGVALNAKLAQPSGFTTDGDALYFVDAESSSLRMLKGGQIRTLVGTGLFDYGLTDGVYPGAMLQHAQGLDYANGKIYLADTYNNAVRIYDTATGHLSTLTKSRDLAEPGDVKVVKGQVFVTDTNHNSIKMIELGGSALTDFLVK